MLKVRGLGRNSVFLLMNPRMYGFRFKCIINQDPRSLAATRGLGRSKTYDSKNPYCFLL